MISDYDDTKSLVDHRPSSESTSHESDVTDPPKNKKKFRFFSIGFNSTPQQSMNTNALDITKTVETPRESKDNPDNLPTRGDSGYGSHASNADNKRNLLKLPCDKRDLLASFDTEGSYEDDVFSKETIESDRITDIDDDSAGEDGDLGMGELLQHKQLFPRGDSLETRDSSARTSVTGDDADAGMNSPALTDVHERIESKSKFNDLYYCTGSTEDLLKEVTGEVQAEKQTRKLVSQYRKLQHNPGDRLADAGDDSDDLASSGKNNMDFLNIPTSKLPIAVRRKLPTAPGNDVTIPKCSPSRVGKPKKYESIDLDIDNSNPFFDDVNEEYYRRVQIKSSRKASNCRRISEDIEENSDASDREKEYNHPDHDTDEGKRSESLQDVISIAVNGKKVRAIRRVLPDPNRTVPFRRGDDALCYGQGFL